MKKNFKVVKMEDNQAILENSNGRDLVWPREELPLNIKEGDRLILTLNKEPDTEEEMGLLAKNILNEILNIKEE